MKIDSLCFGIGTSARQSFKIYYIQGNGARMDFYSYAAGERLAELGGGDVGEGIGGFAAVGCDVKVAAGVSSRG